MRRVGSESLGFALNDFLRRLKLATSAIGRLGHARPTRDGTFEQYDPSFPTNQNAIDLLPGWCTALPPEANVVAGPLGTFHDSRIAWANECFGSLVGKRVLELGPLEGGHTIHLERLGAEVLGIESNKIAFLRCLVVKEIVGLKHATFKLGDFVKWLEGTDETYDLIVASGVLYHMRDPLHLLDMAARRSNALYLWTHFVHDDAMPIGDPRRAVIADTPDIVTFRGAPMRLYKRTYAHAEANDSFNGGMMDAHHWMHRDDILTALRLVGYADIRVAQETPDHQNGPAFSVFARKPPDV